MQTLFETLKVNRLTHFRLKEASTEDRIAYSVLGVLISDVSKNTKNPDDSQILSVVRKYIENAKICISAAVDTAKKAQSETEIRILEKYLPKQLTEDEIRLIIQSGAINKTGGNATLQMIMQMFKTNFIGQYDGATVSKIAREMIQSQSAQASVETT